MGQIIAYTQAELEQEGWVFDGEHIPEAYAVIHGHEVHGDLSAVLDAVSQNKPWYLSVYVQRTGYDDAYPLQCTRVSHTTEDEIIFEGIGERFHESVYIVSVSVGRQNGEVRSVSYQPTYIEPHAIIYQNGAIEGDIQGVISAAFYTNSPFSLWFNSTGNIRYLCNQWYKQSSNEFRFYASYYVGGNINRVRVSVNASGELIYYGVDD